MPRKPNIVFFFADDQRFDTIRALGNPHIPTPNLDALVARGTTFSHAYIMGGSSGAVCMPSRAMLMTGRTLCRIQGQGQEIPANHTLLGEALRSAGYETFGTGKWHNGTRAFHRSFSCGAEIFFGGMEDHWNVPACDFSPTGDYPEPREHTSQMHLGRPKQTGPRVFDHIRAGKHSSELFCDAAVKFLREYDRSRPFFMYVSFMAPHDPRTMPRKFRDGIDEASLPLPANVMPEHPFDNGELRIRDEQLAPWPRTPAVVRQHLADYYAMISHLDAELGRVLKTLEASGLAENTVVVFAGDNGLAVGQHGLMGKQSLYEHSIHVPFIMSGPGIQEGTRCDSLCYLLDIMPTLCDVADVAVPSSVEGISLAPCLQDASHQARDSLVFAYRGLHRAARRSRHKLIEYAVDGNRRTQLFDLENDPLEVRNLAEQPEHADTLAGLRQDLQVWRRGLDDTGAHGRQFWSTYDGTSSSG